LLLATGCAGHAVPVLVPIPTGEVKPGLPGQALVVLPNRGVASIYLDLAAGRGRVALSRIGVVNHHPDRVTLFSARSRVYVDDGGSLPIVSHREFDRRENPTDLHILRDLPEGAQGTWLFPARRSVGRSGLRGPTLVLFYSDRGRHGFVKVRYRAIWGITK